MIDITTIGLDLRTDGLQRGRRELDETGRAADRAADAATRAGSRASNGFREYGSAAAIAERQTRALADTTATFGRLMGTVFASMGAGALIGQIDGYTKFTAQLKLASTGAAEFAGSMESVRRIATSAQADLASMGTLYARIATSTRELGIGQKQIAAITETVGLSLKVSGASAGEAASAMLQLSQAFGSGRLNGQEFAAIAEAAPGLLQILADSLGVSRGALKAMSEQGKLTTEVMVRAFGNQEVIAGLREQSKEVETIGGAFVVLKNNVMEFVGAQAHASGAVSAMTGGIGALANNLDMVTAAALGLATAKIGQVMGDIGVRAAAASTNAAAYTQAQIAQRTAAIAAAQAELAAANATSARLTVTQAALVLARQEAVAALQRANASATAAQSQIAAARAAGAQSFAIASLRQGEVALAAAITARSAATAELAILGQQAARMTAQQTAATVAQTAAQNTLTAAQRTGSLIAGMASTAMAALGGPVAIITTLLGLGVTAWMLWGRAAKDGSTQAEQTVLEKSKSIRETLRSEIALIDKRNAALNYKPGQQGNDDQLAAIGGLQQEIDALRSKTVKNQTEEVARQRDINALLAERGLLEQGIAEKAAKAATEQARKDGAANGEVLLEARRKLLGVGKDYEEQLKRLQGLHASGAIGLAEYREHVNKLATDTYKSSAAGKAAAESVKGSTAAVAKEQSAYEKLVASIKTKIEQNNEEIKSGGKLNDAEKLRIQLTAQTEAGTRKATAAHLAEAQALLKKFDASERALAISQAQKKFEDERDKQGQAIAAEIAKIHEKTQALEDEATAYGKTAVELQALTIARLEDKAAMLTSFDATASEAEIAAIREKIKALTSQGEAEAYIAGLKLGSKTDETLRNAQEMARLQQGELSMAGMTAAQRKLVSEQRKISLEYAKKEAEIDRSGASEAEKAANRAKLEQSKQIEFGVAAAQAQDEAWSGMWASVDQTAHDVFVNVADEGMDAFKRIGKTLKASILDLLYQMTVKKWIISIAGSMAGGAAMAGGEGGGVGVGDAMNAASGVRTLSGMNTGWFTDFGSTLPGSISSAGAQLYSKGFETVGSSMMDFGNSIAGYADAINIAGDVLGYGAAIFAAANGKWGQAIGTAVGTYFGGPIGSFIGSTVGKWADKLFSGGAGTPHMGAGVQYSAAAGVRGGADTYNRSTFGMGVRDEYAEGVEKLISGVATGIVSVLDGVAVTFGKTAGYELATAFADDSNKEDGAWGSLRISKEGQELINWQDAPQSKWAPKEFADGEDGYKEYLAAIAKDTRQVLLDMDLPSWADTLLNSIGEAASMEQLGQAVAQIGQIQTMFVQLGQTVDGFAGMGDKAFEALMKASGGADALSQNVGSFYEGFYSESERMAKATAALTAELAKSGVAMPASKDAYRALVEQQLKAGEGGADLAAKLLQLAPAFAQVEEAERALQEVRDAVAVQLGITTGATNSYIDALAAAAGGMDTLQGKSASFYDKFFTDAEKTAQAIDKARAALASVGLEMPATAQGARALMDAAIALGAAGKGTVIALLDATDGMDAFVNGVKSVGEAVQTAVNSWEQKVDLGGLTGAVRGSWADLIAGIVSDTDAAKIELAKLVSPQSSYEIDREAIQAKAADRTTAYWTPDQKQASYDLINVKKQEQAKLDFSAGWYAGMGPEWEAMSQWARQSADAMAAEITALTESIGRAPPEIQALIDAETALLDARNKQSADKTVAGLMKEVAQLDMSPLEKQLADIAERADEYVAGLKDLGQGTDANIAAVAAWEAAMIAAAKSGGSAAESLTKTTDDAFSALERAVSAQRDVLTESITHLQAVFDIAGDAARDLRSEVESASQQSAAAGRSFIDNALANAQATGYMPDADKLREAIDGVRNGIAAQQGASTFEAERDRLVLAGKLTDLKDIAEPQLTEAQRQLAALEEMLKTARTQIDELRGINVSVLSVADAMKGLAAAIAAEKAVAPPAAGGGGGGYVSSPTNSSGSHTGIGDSGYRLDGNTLYFPGGGSHTVAGAGGAQILLETYGLQQGGSNGTLLRTRAMGGYTPPGMTLVGEEGPELVNFQAPSMIYTAAQTSRLMGGGNTSRLEALVEGLTAEVQRLQGIVARGVEHQRETAEILDNVTEGGSAMRSEVVA